MIAGRKPQEPVECRNPAEAQMSQRLYPTVLAGLDYDVRPAHLAKSDKPPLGRSIGEQEIELDYRDNRSTRRELAALPLGLSGMKTMRRHAEGLLERDTDAAGLVERAWRARSARRGVFDIGDDGPFLPGGKSTPDLRFCGRLPAMRAYQFMCHEYAQGFDVKPMGRTSAFDQCGQPEGHVPKPVVIFGSLPVAFDSHRYGIQHFLLAEGLAQEIDGSSLHGHDRHRDIAMAGHKKRECSPWRARVESPSRSIQAT
jgi:hypothetical protein